MKNIKSIKQLHAERQRLESRQAVLETNILDNWQGLKQGLRPLNLAKGTFNQVLGAVINGNILKTALTFGTGLLVKKLADKGSSKLAGLFKK